ncbi:hypothetical protein BUALT_Bualt05G0134700 [Buddleja alternifolia]|uniref:tRNA(adenine(34)) deaminase n=1 Tax=Buddleja alternifolia TaxID=168488 RepID=A0AAV6XJ22_9LAMI|nr:hypothetical protein BUALT_Bualt05G0134700 [Buddleja alternifolia]
MYNTYLTSRISLRTRASLSFNDYSHCSNERHPFGYSSSRTCCCSCCTNSICKVPTSPSYCYSLYGLRQSSLIQWSPCRKLISGGFDRRCYARVPICDVDRGCNCDNVCSFRERSVGGRKGGLRKCMVFEERSERCDVRGVDEVEVLLSLLTEDIGDEGFCARKETKRMVKKPLVEKRENGEVSKKCGSRKKRVDVGVSESEPRCEYESGEFGSRNRDNRREERIRREEEMEALSREENRKEMLLEKNKDCRRVGRIRGKEERDESMAFGTRKNDNRREERIRRDEERNELTVFDSRTKDNRRDERIWREEERDESVVYGSRNKDNRREERIRWEEEREALSREQNRKTMLQEENEYLLTNRIKREKEERESFLRKASQKDEEKQEREPVLRKENWKVAARREDSESLLRKGHENDAQKQEKESMLQREKWNLRARREEREDLLRREEQRHKMRKDGSSCSSYYSVSSTGDYDSDNEIELSSGYNNEIVKKKNAKEIVAGSSVVESDFRKKSEKILSDVSVEEVESRKELWKRESKFSADHESKNKKSSDCYVGYDDRKVKSNESMRFDEERKQMHRQTGDEVSRHKQFVEMQDDRSDGVRNTSGSQKIYSGNSARDDEYHQRISRKVAEASEIQEIDLRKTSISQQEIDFRKTISHQEIETSVKKQDNLSDDVRYSYGSQEVYGGKGETSAKAASSNQEAVGEHRTALGLRKAAEMSEIQEIDLRKTSISQQDIDFRKTSIYEQGIKTIAKKKEDYSTNILSSINDAAKQKHQYHQVSGMVESSGKSQQLTKKEGTSILKRQSDSKLIKQEESVNLGQQSQKHDKIIRTIDPGNESNQLTNISITHSGEFGATDVEDREKTKSEVLVRPSSSRLPEIGALPVESNVGMTANEGTYGSSQFGSTALNEHNLERSQGQPSKFISQEDAIGSAVRLEKSSSCYVDEFVDKVKNEILDSEMQGEKETNETKLVHEEQQHKKGLIQYTSGRKGPSDEMWDVDEQSVKAEVQQDDASKGGNAIVKRTGRSLWNVITDIVHLRWSPHTESHSSGRKTGERNSPNQSTSSETWFSGHEAEEHEEAIKENERRSNKQGGLSNSEQEGKTRSKIEEGSSSSTSEGYLKMAGSNAPSSSCTEIVETSTPPALKMRRSPVVRRVSETGEENASGSGLSEQLTTVAVDQSESSVSERELKQKKIQRNDQVLRDRFDEWEEAYKLDAEQQKIDEMFMREALLEARKAADNWEVPVGAVLVQNGKIIARGCNLVEELRDSTAHAEMICIREASNILRTWRLSETTLYVTLEPCPMCAGAILQARVDTVVWGAPNKLLGADGSWIRLFPNGDEGNNSEQTDKSAAPVHPFHPKIIIRRRVLASECADTMQQFFQLRRKKKDKKIDPPNSPPSSRLHISHHPSKFMTKMHDAFRITFCL